MSMQTLFYDFGDFGRPFRTLDLLAKEMNRHMDPARGASAAPRSAGRFPAVDVWEKDDAYHLAVELPGVARDDLSITVEGNAVAISAKRELPAVPGFELRARERRAFAFERTFELPAALASDKADASLVNGVLTVTLPKAEERKPRKIEIKSA